jgi:hypothetical protein
MGVLRAGGLALAVAAGALVFATSGDDQPRPLLSDDFDGPDGLVTNGYAFFAPEDRKAARSPVWEVEAGSLLRKDGTGWSGVPDDVDENRDSSNGTGSEVFRMWSRRADLGDVAFEMDLLHVAWAPGSPDWPPKSWDGVKLWLRRDGRSGADVRFYSIEVARRQGNVLIQKKCAGDDYALLAEAGDQPAATGRWERVGATARTLPDGSVHLQLLRGGRVVLEATDRGEGCPPLTAPGRVGIRADNAEFRVDDLTVRPLGDARGAS